MRSTWWGRAFGGVTVAVLMVVAIGGVRADEGDPPDHDPLDQPEVMINGTSVYQHQYGPIFGQDTVTPQLGDPDPGTCRSIGEQTCNVIPLTFVKPAGFTKADTYVARLTLDWDPGQNVQTGTAVGGQDVDDLDLYLWPNPQCPADTTKKCSTDALEKAADSKVPITDFKIDASSMQHFQLVVNHASGTTLKDGYNLKIETIYVPFVPPSESLEPTFSLPPDLSGASGGFTPFATGGGVTSPFSPATPFSPGAALATGDTSVDPSLAGLSGTGVDDAISSGPSIFRRAAATKKPRPASGVALMFTFIVLPLVLVALGGAWFRRRRPAAMTVRA